MTRTARFGAALTAPSPRSIMRRLASVAMLGAGLNALAAAPAMAQMATDQVTYLQADQVKAAFAAGRPLLEVTNYKIHASRRTAAGMGEVHVRDTDIIYVLEGTATFVTGGTLVDGRTVAPDEIRGPSIQGGQTVTLKPGDVMVVPYGTPHWFKEVPGLFLYYVVKVTE